MQTGQLNFPAQSLVWIKTLACEQHLVGEEVDDVADAFGGELRLGGVLHG